MAVLDLINPRRVAIESGAARFHRLMESVKEASFDGRLADVDEGAPPEEAEDAADYMRIVVEIKRCLVAIEAESPDHQEGFMRGLAHVLSGVACGCIPHENFDAVVDTCRAYELRTEPCPQ
jgi:hypothetical protein